jgi:hypothetical protein
VPSPLKIIEKKGNTLKIIERLSSSSQGVAQHFDRLEILSDGVISLSDRGKLEVNLHDTSPGLRCEHRDKGVPQGVSCSTVDCMNHIRFCEGGNENTEDHLIPLTPRKKGMINHGGQSFSSRTGVRNSLGKRQRRTIQKPVSILPFAIGKNLSPPGHEIPFAQLDMWEEFMLGTMKTIELGLGGGWGGEAMIETNAMEVVGEIGSVAMAAAGMED